MAKKIDITGKQFGSLYVLKEVEERRNNKVMWTCICECGKVKDYIGDNLRSGSSTNCGCIRTKIAAQGASKKLKTHGMSKSRLYNIWRSMKKRCYLETCKDYERYGALGVTICNEWLSGFEKFKDWALDNGYEDDLSIDRIDAYGNYEPNNCRWANNNVQARNIRLKKTNTSGHHGVTMVGNKWVSNIKVDGKSIVLGRYDVLEEAINARKEAELKYWG